MAKVQEKLKAIALRRKGKSIKDIASQLEVSKGSVSTWCRDINLTKEQKIILKERQIAAGNKGRLIGAEKNKQKRLSVIAKQKAVGLKEVGNVSKRDLLFLGIGLYWGEGTKSNPGMATLVNSDVSLIKIGKQWFCECLGVEVGDFRPYVYISYQHKKRSAQIINYWSSNLHIAKSQFKIIVLHDRPKKKYQNHDQYFGVLQLRVRKSTDLRYRILGLIDACKGLEK